MYRHRLAYNNVYTHYPRRHHGVNVYSSYTTIPEPVPLSYTTVNAPRYTHGYNYRLGVPYPDYSYYDYAPCLASAPVLPLPPIMQTNVQQDFHYHYDDPQVMYDDTYGNGYRLSRSKVQLVDVAPQTIVQKSPRRTIVSTYRSRDLPERIIAPRSTIVQQTSFPSYIREKPRRIVPLYHSARF